MTSRVKVTRGSGNVFADLGFDNPQEEEIKAAIVRAIRQSIEANELSQTQAAKRMGIHQPDLSKLLRGRVLGFSLERLLDCLRDLGNDVEIRVKPVEAEKGRMVLETGYTA